MPLDKENKKKYQKKYQAKPAQKKAKAARYEARRDAIASGAAKRHDGKEVDHIKPLKKGGTSSKANTRVVSRKTNRAKGSK